MSASPLGERLADLTARLAALGRVAVAFSGGVDSTLVARIAAAVLPGRVEIFFVDSVFQAACERAAARKAAAAVGLSLRTLRVDVLEHDDVRANPPQRCYHCKRLVFAAIAAHRAPGAVMIDGTNADDDVEERPGARACRELGVVNPLRAAGLGKAGIRGLARCFSLPNWDKPAASCLATRIPTGTRLTPGRLALVEQGEAVLTGLGLAGSRLRLTGKGRAVVEVPAGGIRLLAAEENRERLLRELGSLGFDKVLLDLSERAGILSSL